MGRQTQGNSNKTDPIVFDMVRHKFMFSVEDSSEWKKKTWTIQEVLVYVLSQVCHTIQS